MIFGLKFKSRFEGIQTAAMRKRSSQHRNLRPTGFWARIAHFFRERQIYVRSKGEVQFVTIKPYMMVLGLFILMSGFFWTAFAAINVMFKDELIAVKERDLYQSRLDHEQRIADLRRTIDRLNEKLMLDQNSYLQEVDKLRAEYGRLVQQQKQLAGFFRQGWLPLKQPVNDGTDSTADRPDVPSRPGKGNRQAPVPNKSGKSGFKMPMPGQFVKPVAMAQKYAKPFKTRKQALAPLGDTRKEMQGFAKMQSRLLDEVNVFAKKQTANTRKIYAGLGLVPDRVLAAAKSVTSDSVGGPFVAAVPGRILDSAVQERVTRAVLELNRNKLLLQQSKKLPLALPVRHITRISSRFGLRRDPIRRIAALHTGIDIKAAYATKIRATADGVVVRAGWAGGYGRMVEIKHANGLSTKYAHMARILVKKGQRVVAGKAIGLLGSSGRSTGAHLHYETRLNGRAMNPERFWKARHDFQTLSK